MKALLILANLFFLVIGLIIGVRTADRETVSYMLIVAESSYFIGCARQGQDLSACRDMADKWRIQVEKVISEGK